MSDSFLDQLQQGVETLGLNAIELPLQDYLSYIELLVQWNSAYNLTAVREPGKMLAYHVLDSLSILPFIHGDDCQGNKCLDIGTGAGLPGIILAMAKPDTHWVLLDGNNKKIRFVQQAVMTLNLSNVEVVCSRIEKYQTEQSFSTIVSRAFTSLDDFYSCSQHLLAPGGTLLAMKGPDPENEISNLSTEEVTTTIIPLSVPGVTAARTLVQIVPR
jgi:16S rRNA (guanine527-N7)-methyltransferase